MAAAISRRRQAQPWVTTLVRLVLAGVFGYSGLHKIVNPVDSVVAVRAYQILPESLVEPVGYGQPFLELAIAVLLLAGIVTRLAGVATTVLLLVFITAVASAWARGMSIDCGCFSGGGPVEPGETHYLRVILRDIGLALLAAWAVVFPPGRFAVDTVLDRRGPDSGGAAPEGDEPSAAVAEAGPVTETERTR